MQSGQLLRETPDAGWAPYSASMESGVLTLPGSTPESLDVSKALVVAPLPGNYHGQPHCVKVCLCVFVGQEKSLFMSECSLTTFSPPAPPLPVPPKIVSREGVWVLGAPTGQERDSWVVAMKSAASSPVAPADSRSRVASAGAANRPSSVGYGTIPTIPQAAVAPPAPSGANVATGMYGRMSAVADAVAEPQTYGKLPEAPRRAEQSYGKIPAPGTRPQRPTSTGVSRIDPPRRAAPARPKPRSFGAVKRGVPPRVPPKRAAPGGPVIGQVRRPSASVGARSADTPHGLAGAFKPAPAAGDYDSLPTDQIRQRLAARPSTRGPAYAGVPSPKMGRRAVSSRAIAPPMSPRGASRVSSDSTYAQLPEPGRVRAASMRALSGGPAPPPKRGSAAALHYSDIPTSLEHVKAMPVPKSMQGPKPSSTATAPSMTRSRIATDVGKLESETEMAEHCLSLLHDSTDLLKETREFVRCAEFLSGSKAGNPRHVFLFTDIIVVTTTRPGKNRGDPIAFKPERVLELERMTMTPPGVGADPRLVFDTVTDGVPFEFLAQNGHAALELRELWVLDVEKLIATQQRRDQSSTGPSLPQLDREKPEAALDAILLTAGLNVFFRAFLERSLNSENLLFFLEVYEFRNTAADWGVSQRATSIWTNFVAPNAPIEINIDSRQRGEVEAEMNAPTRFVFDAVHTGVWRLLVDTIPNFFSSPEFARAQSGEAVPDLPDDNYLGYDFTGLLHRYVQGST
jgi:Regulator of G protein signaling domain